MKSASLLSLRTLLQWPGRFGLALMIFSSVLVSSIFAAPPAGDALDFRADYYRRDLGTNTIIGKGHAWVKRGTREISADTIEVLLNEERIHATGNVHLRDTDLHVWASQASFGLNGDDATMEDARLIAAQLVVTGKTLRRFDKVTFEVDDGEYSNCNLSLSTDPSVAECPMDWKISGRRFHLTLGSYAHFYDVLMYAKSIPMLYSPYLIVPVKTERQSGLLMPTFSTFGNLGSGVSLPIYFALGPWHDLTITPTQYSRTGPHLKTNYRYDYDGRTKGDFNLFFTRRRYGSDRAAPQIEDKSRPYFLGLLGESAIDLHNQIYLGPKSHTRQVLRWVSHPYYTFDYPDIPGADLGYLRSQLSLTQPFGQYLFTATAQHHQSLIVSRDQGVDDGPVSMLPSIGFSRVSSPVLSDYFSFEGDAIFNNYYRGSAFDQVPLNPANSGVNFDSDRGFDANDYLRTGRRLQLEPRLVAHVPMPPGLQLQPVLRAGTLLYHFDYPTSSLLHREYAELEVPFSLYLSKHFRSGITGFEEMSHVFQPRVVFASSLYQSQLQNHPFFYEDSARSLANPRFDLLDQVFPYQYLRFELINRFRRKDAKDKSIDRFWLLMISEQFNTRTSPADPRYQSRLGPIEFLSDLRLWRFNFQLQGLYQLEGTRTVGSVTLPEAVHENEWSSSIYYDDPGGDKLRLNSLFRHRADPAATDQLISLSFFKTLPFIFDLDGSVEYSMRKGELRGYRLGFHFRERPLSCWRFSIGVGRNAFYQPFALFNFTLDFGTPSMMQPAI